MSKNPGSSVESDRVPRSEPRFGGDDAMPLASLPERTATSLPEISLVAAIFDDAVRCARRSGLSVTHRQSEEALEWIASERRDWPFAFANVCDFLGMDAHVVRMRLGMGVAATVH
jgi:hypothetical protein